MKEYKKKGMLLPVNRLLPARDGKALCAGLS